MRRRARTTVLWLGLTLAFVALRLNLSPVYMNGDEAIVLAVSDGMRARGDLDTNWRLAAPPDAFRYDQYNFSSYHLVAHGWLTAVGDRLPPLLAARLLNLILQAGAVIALLLALRRHGATPAERLAVAALLTVAPTGVHDAMMARPESFLYLLFAILIWLAAGVPTAARGGAAAALLGLGVATKVTFLTAALLFAPAAARAACRRPRAALAGGLAVVLLAAAGFATGAPHAVADPTALLNGLTALHAQYTGGHPPHSLPDSTWPRQLGQMIGFCLVIYGPLLPAALLPALVERRGWWLGLWASAVATLALFSAVPVFFERNLAVAFFALPALMVFGTQPWPRLRAATLALALVPMIGWSVTVALAAHFAPTWRQEFERRHGLGVVTTAWLRPALGSCRGTLAIVDYGDPLSAAQVARVRAAGHREIATYHSPFEWVPTSTLHTYLDRTTHYFDCTP